MRDANALLLKSKAEAGTSAPIAIGPDEAGWEYISLRVQRVQAGGFVNYSAASDEVCLVPLKGTARIESDGQEWTVSRPGTMFDGKPAALYLPVGSSMTITAGDEDIEIAIAGSRATEHFPARLIRPDDIEIEIRGAGNAARQISHIIKPDFPAHRLLVVEVFTPSGNWSSFPPHKHDVSNLPEESDLEEIYYYRIHPSDGFGLQRLYTADGSFDHAWVIKDGDLLLVPEGYHAFAVAHGYTGYYLNVLAGNESIRTMQPSDDPAYAWVRETWPESLNEGITSWRDIDARVNAGAGTKR